MKNEALRFQEPIQLQTRANFVPSTVDENARTVQLVWTTGARVLRRGFFSDDYYEELSMDASAIRMDRLNQGAPLLDSHNGHGLDNVLGVVERAWLDGDKGYAVVRFSERDAVESIFRDVKSGILRNISVGYSVYEYEVTERSGELSTYRAVDWEPHELSIVPIPADKDAQFRAKESPTSEEAMATKRTKVESKEAPVEDLEVRAEAVASEESVTETKVEASTREADNDCGCAEPIEKVERKAPEQVSDADRTAAIFSSVRKANLGVDVAERLITSGVSVSEAREQIIAEMAKSEATVRNNVDVIRDEQETTRSAVAEAILHRVNPAQNKLTDLGRQYRGMTMLEMARDTLEKRGVNTRGMSKLELAGRALHSTSDFPYITADVMGKTLRDQYDAAPRTFTAWARQTTAPDFKTIKRIQLGDAPSLTKVNENGEFSYGTIGEGQETYVLSTYGKIIPMGRQLLINDDMSAFTRVTALMARAAADLESDIVYGILADNAALSDGKALFHADHSNLGTAGAISITTLDEARKAMRNQTNLAGRPINVTPSTLVVGPASETAAWQFINAQYSPDVATAANPFQGSMQVVVDPRITGNAWYVMASPSQIDTIEYAYLEGQQGVYMDTEMGFDVDGVKFKVRHDFGAGAIDHRGVFKNAGS